jgi:hypothetical protein
MLICRVLAAVVDGPSTGILFVSNFVSFNNCASFVRMKIIRQQNHAHPYTGKFSCTERQDTTISINEDSAAAGNVLDVNGESETMVYKLIRELIIPRAIWKVCRHLVLNI